MIQLYLLLGGNMGDKARVFLEAKAHLLVCIGEIQAQSAIYETEPWGFESNDLFWNQALMLSTSLSPDEVLEQTQAIELKLGRIRKENQYSSRVIDIDILFYGDTVVKTEKLTIPHPRIQDRKFALVPLVEIAPQLVHPVFQKSMQELLTECTDLLKVNPVKNSEE